METVSFSSASALDMRVEPQEGLRHWFEASPAPRVLVTRAGKVLFANAAARVFLAKDHGFALRGGRIVARDLRVEQHFAAALQLEGKRAVLASGLGGAPACLAVSEPGGGDCVMVSFRLIGMKRLRSYEHVARHFELSPQQTRIVAQLIHGRGVEEIAARQKIKAATVRSHLKSIFQKLEVSNQAGVLAKFVRYLD